MEVSGTAREGWMTFVPLTVLVLIVVYVMGGPVTFVNTLSYWATDAVGVVTSWLKYL